MPAVVFTDPQVGSVGLTEARARVGGENMRAEQLPGPSIRDELDQPARVAGRQGARHVIADAIFPYLTTVEGLKLAAQTFDRDVSKLSCCAG
jgi:mercuric reductase